MYFAINGGVLLQYNDETYLINNSSRPLSILQIVMFTKKSTLFRLLIIQ